MTTPERLNAIITLLQTRDEGLPTPTRRDHTPSGFAHDITVSFDCPDCLTNGRRMKACETCGGSGHIEEHRDRDPYAVNDIQPFGLTPDRHEARRRRDATIDRLDEQTRPPYKTPADELAAANAHGYAWETERHKRYRAYDYAALDTALEQLRDHDPAAYHLLHSVYVYGYAEATVTVEAAVLRGLVFLAGLMPDPIRAPGNEHPGKAKQAERRKAA